MYRSCSWQATLLYHVRTRMSVWFARALRFNCCLVEFTFSDVLKVDSPSGSWNVSGTVRMVARLVEFYDPLRNLCIHLHLLGRGRYAIFLPIENYQFSEARLMFRDHKIRTASQDILINGFPISRFR